jgi:hypothetical protein
MVITITPSFYSINKIYDGTSYASINNYILNGVNNIDISNVYITNYIALYRNYNVNDYIFIDISGLILGGSAAYKYNLNSLIYTISGNINPKTLIITTINKNYDGTNNALLSISGIIGSDNIIYTSYYSNPYVGNNRVINVTLSNLISLNSNNLVYYYNFNNVLNNTFYNNVTCVYDCSITLNGCLNLPQLFISSYTGITIAFWMKISIYTNNNYLFYFTNNTCSFYCRYNNGTLFFSLGLPVYQFYCFTNVFDNNLHHVALSISKSSSPTILLYIDGIQQIITVDSGTLIYPYFAAYTIATINYNPSSINISGGLQDFRYYNQTLSTLEIASLYNKIFSYYSTNNNNNNYQLPITTLTSNILSILGYNGYVYSNVAYGIALSSDESVVVFCGLGGGFLYYSLNNNGMWSNINIFNNNYLNYTGIKLSADGSRGVVTVYNNFIYFFTNNYNTLTQTLDNTTRYYNGIAMMSDGTRIVVIDNNYIYYATWNGTNYGVCIKTLDTISRNYSGIACSNDGLVIAYTVNTGYTYWAKWDGSNYSIGVQILDITIYNSTSLLFSDDYTILYLTTNNNPLGSLWYSTWNDINYTSFISISSTIVSNNLNIYSSAICNNSLTIYLSTNSTLNISKINMDVYFINNLSKQSLINNNYIFSSPNTSANIFQRYLRNMYTSLLKVYNANTQGQTIYTISGIYPGDIVDISNIYLSTFATAYVGTNIPVYISNVCLTGPDYFNYNITISSYCYGTILPATLIGNYTGIDKVYNTNTTTNILFTLSGIYSGDSVNISSYLANFASPYVNNNITINISNIILNSTNYTLATWGYASANITPALLTSNFYSLGKVYDRNSYAPIAYNLSGFFDSDIGFLDISAIWMSNYRNVNTGNNYIDISNIKIYGSSAYNYIISNYTTISGLISQRYLYTTGNDKDYDKTTIATITISNLVGNDIVIYTANFDTLNVGINKIISYDFSILTLDSDPALKLYYKFDIVDVNNLLVYNYATNSYDLTLSTTGLIVSSHVCIGTGSYTVTASVLNQQYATTANITINNSGYTIAYWFYQTLSSNGSYIWVWNNVGSLGSPLQAFFVNGTIPWFKGIGDIQQGYTGTFTNNTWYHFVWTIKYNTSATDATHTFYWNGIQFSTLTESYLTTGSTGAFVFTNNNQYWKGSIDDFRVYNRVLNSDQILALYNNTQYNINNVNNYQFYTKIKTANIFQRYLYSTGVNKIYDQQLVATLTISNIVGNDVVSYFAEFDDINSGFGKLVYLSLSSNVINYKLFNNLTTANIYKKQLTPIYFGINKVYNAITLCSISYTLSGIIKGDFVDISNFMISNFIDIDVGVNKLVYINNVALYGSSYLNYYIDSSGYTNAAIYQKSLTSNFYSLGKVYDRNSYAPVWYSLSGLFDLDLGHVDISASFWVSNYRDYNVNKNIIIDVSNIIIWGDRAFNYNIPFKETNNTGIISHRYLYSTGMDKIYDQQLVATLTISNIVGNDVVSYFAEFDDINSGFGKLVYLSLSSNVNNYQLFNNLTNANIYKKQLTPIYFGINKIYNAITLCSISYTLSGIIKGDFVDISNFMISNFIDIDVGVNKLVYINNVALYGSSYFNYYIDSSGYTNAAITQQPIFYNFYSNDKVYDRNSYVSVYYSLSGIFDLDLGQIDISNIWMSNYRQVNSGSHIPIDISNIVLYGDSRVLNNYSSIKSTNSITGLISRKYLYSTGVNKIYDQSTIAYLTISGIIPNDIVYTTSFFDNIHIGSSKLITISNILTGTQFNNYQLFNNVTNANIYQKALTIYFNGGDKIYDRNTSVGGLNDISYNFSGVITGDELTISSLIAHYQQVTTGPQLVDISNIKFGGFSANNYYVVPPQSYYANILHRGINALFYSSTKIYDNNNIATLNIYGSLSGIIGTDSVTISSYIGFYRDYRANFQIIDISDVIITGPNAFNYYLYNVECISGFISQKALTPIYFGGTKIYDGTRLVFNLTSELTGILNLDQVTISSFTSIYQSIYRGYQFIDVSNYIITGIDSNNYYIPPINPAIGLITPKLLLVSYIPITKLYSGTIFNSYRVNYNGFINIDSPNSLSGQLKYAIYVDIYKNQNIINWILVGSNTVYSSDGITFETTQIQMKKITNNNQVWIGINDKTIYISTDGINWSIVANNTNYNNITWTGSQWFVIGDSVYSSINGYNWNLVYSNTNSYYAISGTKDIIIIGGDNMKYSLDNGINWFITNTVFTMCHVITNNNVFWVAGGVGSYTLAYSYNGIQWIGGDNYIFTKVNSIKWNGIMWVAVGNGNSSIAYSYEGIYWVGIGNYLFINGFDLDWDGSKWIACGDNTTVTSTNSIDWITINISLSGFIGISCHKSINFVYPELVNNVGTYTMIPNGLYSNNYLITYLQGITQINQTQLKIIHNNYNKVYNGYEFSNYGVTYNGFVGYDNSFNLTGQLTYTSDYIKNVGQYNITPSGLVGYNYNIAFVPGLISITKAPLVIRANNNIKIYDKKPIVPLYTIYGLLGNDTETSLTGSIIFSGTYQNQINTGNYNISVTGYTSNNYDIKYIPGIVTITKAPLFITAKDDSRIFVNDVSGFILVYNPNYYVMNNYNSIQSIYDTNNRLIVWSLNGFIGPCYLSFNPPDINCSIGLSELNYNYTDIANYKTYMISNIENVFNIVENGSSVYEIGSISDSILIQFDGQNINYYVNNNLIKSTIRTIRKKLYINLTTNVANQYITNINFGSLQEYYSNGNGFNAEGLISDDTINDLDGSIVYSGTSQNAYKAGNYTIIPSGLTSNNYNIQYINGILTIKRSLLS